MKQISIVFINGNPQIAGINDYDAEVEASSDSLTTYAIAMADEMDQIKSPDQQVLSDLTQYIKETAPDEVLFSFKHLFDSWEDWIGKRLPTDELVVYEGLLYRCTRELDVLAHYPPPLVPTHYSAVGHPPTEDPDEPKTYPQWTQQGWELGAIVWNFDRLWENVLEGQVNTWEPGTPGIDERYWVDVTERELGDGD